MEILELSYPGRVVRRDVPLRVFLPPCFPSPGRRYPVVILLHGKPFDQMHWDEVGLDEAIGLRVRDGRMPAAILAMPLVPEPLFSQTDGGPGSYEEEALDGLIPFLRQTWPIEEQAALWAIAGISRGGIWSLEIGMRHPEVFGAVVALSPSLLVNYPRPAYDPMELANPSQDLPERVFLGAGETDWARPKTVDLAERLAAAARPHRLHLVPGGHETATWTALLDPFLEYVFDGWPGAVTGQG